MGSIFFTVCGMTWPDIKPATSQSQGGHSTIRPVSWCRCRDDRSVWSAEASLEMIYTHLRDADACVSFLFPAIPQPT